MKKQVTPGETPAQITVSMIDQDLKDGVSKTDMAVKYGIKAWEVDEMFKHPFLKGRRPSRKKALSFSFVDDTTPTQFPSSMEDVTEEIDPNQVTLEKAIDEAIETVEEVKTQMQETQDAVVELLSPTEETPEETLLKIANSTPVTFTEPQENDELEMDDDTFEL